MHLVSGGNGRASEQEAKPELKSQRSLWCSLLLARNPRPMLHALPWAWESPETEAVEPVSGLGFPLAHPSATFSVLSTPMPWAWEGTEMAVVVAAK